IVNNDHPWHRDLPSALFDVGRQKPPSYHSSWTTDAVATHQNGDGDSKAASDVRRSEPPSELAPTRDAARGSASRKVRLIPARAFRSLRTRRATPDRPLV